MLCFANSYFWNESCNHRHIINSLTATILNPPEGQDEDLPCNSQFTISSHKAIPNSLIVTRILRHQQQTLNKGTQLSEAWLVELWHTHELDTL